jgi:mono/diheme cytochrome c family protein
MATPAPRNLAARRLLFTFLLAFIAITIAYAIFQNRPWTVPEEAKQRTNPLQTSDAVLQSARAVYSEKCASCHGDTGKGDGHDASLYGPAPTDFSDGNHMRAVTDGELFYKISEGHRPMPAFKKRLTEEQRWQLVLLLRSFTAPSAEHGGTFGSAPNTSDRHP